MGASYKSVKNQPKRQKIELANSREAEAILLFMEAGLMPQEAYVGRNQKWKSKCMVCGAIVSPRVADVLGREGGCRPCATERQKKDGLKRFPKQTKKALSIAKKAKLEPLEPYKNARTKWKCKCLKCGEIVTPTYHNLEQGNGGCLNCQPYSFQPKEPAYLYVMTHTEMGSLKIGIGNSNNKVDRIKTHKRYGWELVKRYDLSGKMAMDAENALLQWIRKDLKLPKHLTGELMKQFGYSETVNSDDIELPTLYRKITEIIKGLQK